MLTLAVVANPLPLCDWWTTETLFSEALLAPPINSTKAFLLWRRHSEYYVVTDCVKPTEVSFNVGLLMLNTGSHVPVCIRWQCSASWESVLFFLLRLLSPRLYLCCLHCLGVYRVYPLLRKSTTKSILRKSHDQYQHSETEAAQSNPAIIITLYTVL